jgi:predicted dinucleotide-binding enzyme
MRIGVIGSGRVGSALGRGMARAGHELLYGSRNPDGAAEHLRHERARVLPVREAVAASEVLLLATPWAATQAALEAAGDLGGRALFDATNPIGPGAVLTHGHTDSGGEQVQRWAPSAKVVKVFNTTGMENMLDPVFPAGRALMLACGDDDDAVQIAVRLAHELGFEGLPFGPLKNARLLEPFGRAWIELAMVRGAGRGVAFGLLRR